MALASHVRGGRPRRRRLHPFRHRPARRPAPAHRRRSLRAGLARGRGRRGLLPRPADPRHAGPAPHRGPRPLRHRGDLRRLPLLGTGYGRPARDADAPRHAGLGRRRRRGRLRHLPRPPQRLHLRHQHAGDADGPAGQQRELLHLRLGRVVGGEGAEERPDADQRQRRPRAVPAGAPALFPRRRRAFRSPLAPVYTRSTPAACRK